MTPSGFGKALDEPAPDGVDASAAPAESRDRGVSGALERLRDLLLGDERRALEAANARIAELENAQKDLPRRLPGAAIEAMRGGPSSARVADALSEPVAQALGAAVRNNRQSLVDALFPIIGPMIRKAIAEALSNLVTDLNGAIESSFTLRGLKWRVEAWRAGVPYAQVVLKHRLAYRIDHVFLIVRESGLVLQHEAAPELAPLDADAIAGMLTALGDFVGESVGRGGGTLDSARVGEHLVWVVQGPQANLACFMRGVPPAQLRTLLERRLEDLHAAGLDTPAGADADASPRHAWLQPAALQAGTAEVAATPTARPARWPLLLIVLALLFALGWFVAGRMRWNARIDALRAQLAAHPGFVLIGIEATPWRSVTVRGLVDADAEPPDLAVRGIDFGGIHPRFDATAYVSGDDAVLVRRATRLLAPPPGVRLAAHHGVLSLGGSAPAAWIAVARERAGWIAGVSRAEIALAPATDAGAAARGELERMLPGFAQMQVAFADDSRPQADADAIVDAIARALRHARALARSARVELVADSIGTTDSSGGAEVNTRLRGERARWLAQALAARGVDAVRVPDPAEGAPVAADRRGAHLRVTIGAHAR